MTRVLDRLRHAACAAPLLAGVHHGQDWTNYGGSAERHGATEVCGPTGADLLWTADDPSLIAWHPLVADGRVCAVRQSAFPVLGGAAGDELVAYALESGAELWRTSLPYAGNPVQEWTAWIGGMDRGRVYALRSSNTAAAPLRAFDAATGALVWTSQDTVLAGPHDGVVFAPDGDLLVGDALYVTRLRAGDGSTAWRAPRTCVVSGSCGVAASASAAYLDEPTLGGVRIVRLDLATGARRYAGPTMVGVTEQNTPFLSASGDVVYFSMSGGTPLVDRLYAFRDDGTALTELWSRPIRWTVHHEHGLAPDGGIFAFLQDDQFVKLDPVSGAVLASAGKLAPLAGSAGLSPKTAVDRDGRVYVSNGWNTTPATAGRVWAFAPDLAQPLFTLTLDKPGAGGPALAARGTLVLADRQGVHAYRSGLAARATVRRGSPPNPEAFRPGLSGGPFLGEPWDPYVDHASFLSAASLDFVLIAEGPALNVPLGIGTLLCAPPPAGRFFGGAPGQPFAIPIPPDCSFLGRSLYAQAGAHEAGTTALTNGLDLVVGNR